MAPERDLLLSLEKKLAKRGCPVRFLVWPEVPPAAGRPQQVIFDHFPVETWDIFVGLLWNRFGSPAGEKDDRTGKPMTGTEEEFIRAYKAWKDSDGKRPHIAVYRCERPEVTKGKGAQIAAVDAFFEQLAAEKQFPALTCSFTDPHKFKDDVEEHLVEIIAKIRAAEKIGTTSPRKKTPKITTPAPDSGTWLHRYFANLRAQFETYENLGLPVPERDGKEGEKDAPLLIRKLFVEPTCTEEHLRPEAFDAALREGKNPATPLLPRLAPEKSRTVLLADPGMGKSTLIQWLISTLADEAVPPGAEALRGAVPLPFILRDLVTHLPQNVKDWDWNALVEAFRQWRHRGKGAPLAAPLTADDAFFRSFLATPNAFFLIDGLDEIGDPQRRLAIRDAIWEGFEKYPKSRWLITSRIVGYEQASVEVRSISKKKANFRLEGDQLHFEAEHHPSAGGRFRLYPGKNFVDSSQIDPEQLAVEEILADLLHLAPFDDTQQLAFAQNWYVPRLGDAAGTQRAEDFIAAVHRNDHIRVISRVPNLLYLLALLYRHKAHLPDGRALVYDAISTAYLAGIDLDKRLPDSLVAPWKFEEKEDLLALVAMRMQELRVAQTKRNDKKTKDTRGEILATRAQLEEWLGPRFPDAKGAIDCDELHHFLDHIANRSGLLLPRGEGIFGFAHLSFQEYYAACYLEKEFQRILTEKSLPAGDDIFGTQSVATKKDEEKMFAEMAAQPVWHEPLLFLVEKLRHSPPYTSRILGWTFPQLATEPPAAIQGRAFKAIEKWMPLTSAQLLAGVSLDQEVALGESQRVKIWRSLWQAHIAALDPNWNIAPSLIVAGSAYHTAALTTAAALKPAKFHLFRCTAVSDLTPLANLASLSELFLISCTAVSDLSPLARLASLSKLSLTRCKAMSDLSPLVGLASLKSLYLIGCTAVSDLSPLAGLASLKTLYLTGCRAVSDLAPLESLHSLRELHLDAYTGIDEMQVRALQEKLPKLKIIGTFGGNKE